MKIRFWRRFKFLVTILKNLALLGVVVILWSTSFFAVSLSTRFTMVGKNSDIDSLMTVLFGASSIALFLFSIIFAFFSLFGWQSVKRQLLAAEQLERDTRDKIGVMIKEVHTSEERFREKVEKVIKEMRASEERLRDKVDNVIKDVMTHENLIRNTVGKMTEQVNTYEERRIKPLELEMRARIHSMLGYLLAEPGITNDFKVRRNGRANLEIAIVEYETALKLLESARGKPIEFMILNNYIYYLTFTDHPLKRSFIVEESRRLLKEAQIHESINLMLTACKAILIYSSDQGERQNARGVLVAIQGAPQASSKEKREASHYLASLSEIP